MKKRILFVDDQDNALRALQRMLRSKQDEWEMTFVGNGTEALQALERDPADLVVSELRMEGLDGALLLNQVRDRFPATARIVLSGECDEEIIRRTVGPSHQYLSKPCEGEVLVSVITRVLGSQETLVSVDLKRLVAGLDKLPSLPSLYQEIVEELQSADPSVKRVGEIVSQDAAMTAKILQLVNSAYFGLPRQVHEPGMAASLLGMETIKGLVLSSQVFSQFDESSVSFEVGKLWQHSLACGLPARQISRAENLDAAQRDVSFTACLLHDVGKLVLGASFPDEYRRALRAAQEQGVSLWRVEQDLWGATHAEVGGYLLSLWGLPQALVDAVAHHHDPGLSSSPGMGPALVTHLADVLEHRHTGADLCGVLPDPDEQYLAELGLADRFSSWETIFQEESERD